MLPDAWQAQAITGLKAGRDVVVDAPTGAGKTYVFERWAEQGNFSKRALFTVPTRALANDKYAEWKARGWRVGITTGDVTIDPGAPVVVATLEAVQGLLTRGTDSAANEGEDIAGKNVESVKRAREPQAYQLLVIDEYQWIADEHRGNHYEGVIVALDPAVQLLMLSGAVANPEEVASWLQRLGRKAEVVRTLVRPVPLEEVDVDDLVRGLPKSIEGFWSKRVAGALREGLGPVLVFAPHRQDAERLAKQFARELPLSNPLTLTAEQEMVCGPQLTRLLRQRVAYHHSGLTYAQRAGVIEPLAKAGQLRAVVATLGLAAGINFSLRSVMITAASYRFDQLEHEIAPHDLLQMIGRAGRRGMDEVGYVLCSGSMPRMRRAAPLRLKRAEALPWAILLRELKKGGRTEEIAARVAARFFTDDPIVPGAEITAAREAGELPCRLRTDTGRARLVRRVREPFPGCADCGWREECFQLSPEPTLLWQWQRCGVLDRELALTPRGEIVAAFLGPEGLALAAALEDRRYPVADLIFDCANLFAGDRFAGTNPRRLGRLAAVCERAYRRLTIEGYLVEGLPPQYGFGGSDVVHALVVDGERARVIAAMPDAAGRGDIDRLMTEWRSLLRQIAGAPPITVAVNDTPGAASAAATRAKESASYLAERWDELRLLARQTLGGAKADTLPELPALTVEQRRPVNHHFFKTAPAVAAGR